VKKKINLKAVLILTAVLLSLGGAVHFVHAFQIKRNAVGLRDQADLVEKEGKSWQALGFWAQYVGMVPDDTDALARHALLFEKTTRDKPAARARAFFKLENVLRRDPKREDIRRLAALVAMEFRRYPDAKEHLSKLRDANPKDASLVKWMAYCASGEEQYEKAAELFRKALSLDEHDIELYVGYASLLRQKLDQAETADQQIEAMIEANKELTDAKEVSNTRMEAARYYYRTKQWEKAAEHLTYAMDKLNVRTVGVFLLAADVARARNNTADAQKYYEQGLKLHPDDRGLKQSLARLLHATGHRVEATNIAVILLKKALDPPPGAQPKAPADDFFLADLLLLVDQPELARKAIAQFKQKGAKVQAEFLEGRLAMHEEAWAEARKHLEYVRGRRGAPPDLVREANLYLATCYEYLANQDQQLEACHRSLQGNPQWLPGRIARAACLASMGRTEPAIGEYQKLAKEAIPGARLKLARLLLDRNLGLPPDRQDWASVQQELDKVTPGPSDGIAVQLLRAEVLFAQKKLEEARKVAEVERDRDPKQIAPWMFLVSLAQIQGKTEFTKQLIDEAEKKTGKQVEWTISRLRLRVRSEAPAEIKRELSRIEKELSQYPENDHAKLLLELADTYNLAGETDSAIRLWKMVADRKPNDIRVRFRLLEAALASSREAEAQDWLAEIRRVEGPDGAVGTYGEAALLVRRAQIERTSGNLVAMNALLSTARPRLAAAAALSPSWSRVPFLEANIFEMRNQQDKAMEKYQAALDRGDKRLGVLRRMILLLHEKGRYSDAEALMRKIPDEMLVSSGLKRIKAELSLLGNKDGDPAQVRARALAMARKAVQETSADYQDWMWLGHIAAAAEQPEEAEKALRKARDLKRDAPAAWAALISLLARTDATKAEVEILNAKRELKEQSPLVVAAGYEALGKKELAAESYRAALEKQPRDMTLLRNAAAFYRRDGKSTQAEAILRKILEPSTAASEAAAAWARRNLALTLAARGTFQQFQEAQDLLDKNHKLLGDTEEDRRTSALVLASQPSQRRKAIALFVALSGDQTPAPDTQFLLAQLYEADGKWDMAKVHLQNLVSTQEDNATYLARLVFLLLRHNEPDIALPHVLRLTKLKPNTLETVMLHARVLKANGRQLDAINAVHAFARSGNGPLAQVAYLFEELGQKDEAEVKFREFAAASKRPEDQLILASFLARADKIGEALAICEQAWQTCAPETVGFTSVVVLRAGRATEAQGQQVEKRLKEALAKYPAKRGFVQLLAEFHDYYGHDQQAVALYRDLLQSNPRSVSALNNLAVLLALKGKGADALPLIEKAIEIAGPQPELLDTRAMVHLSERHPEQALSDLDEAISLGPTPLFYFHKARAFQMKSDRSNAQTSLEKAKNGGLTPADLPRLEQPHLQSLEKELRGG